MTALMYIIIGVISIIGSTFGAIAWLNKAIDTKNKKVIKDELKPVWKRLDKQSLYIEENSNQIEGNEISRLKHNIIKKASKLRHGGIYEVTWFTQVFEEFDRYQSLGGNSYAVEEMEFIKKMYHKQHGAEVLK